MHPFVSFRRHKILKKGKQKYVNQKYFGYKTNTKLNLQNHSILFSNYPSSKLYYANNRGGSYNEKHF